MNTYAFEFDTTQYYRTIFFIIAIVLEKPVWLFYSI